MTRSWRHLSAVAALEARSLGQLAQAGMVQLDRPSTLRRAVGALRDAGPLAATLHLAAGRHADRIAVIDDDGTVTFAEVRDRALRLAGHWASSGLTSNDVVGVLARNHRTLMDATFAAVTIGARVVLLNTDFSPPQAADVCGSEGVTALVHDAEFSDHAGKIDATRGSWVAWSEDGPSRLEAICAAGPTPTRDDLPTPAREATLVLLTSGTTGRPKGADRHQPRSLSLMGGLLSRIPYRPDGPILVASPLFHALGLGTALLNFSLGNALVLSRSFDATAALDSLERHRCSSMTVVPVMLNRLLSLGAEEIRARDLSALRIVLSAGARLHPQLSERVMDVFGDVLYNLYGSTEVSAAAIATPADLRAAPGCVGLPPLGVTVRILDDDGRPCPQDTVGRIFVGSPNTFDGYTGGGSKEVIDGLMSSGDLGHVDRQGRLHIDGRDDDMIVSGGENVFPAEVEAALMRHPAVDQACVVGVDDIEFGQRLRAVVVCRPGQTVDAEELRRHVRENLARYKVPREVRFVDELPRNPTGKVLRHALVD